jgi:hypothetical protein
MKGLDFLASSQLIALGDHQKQKNHTAHQQGPHQPDSIQEALTGTGSEKKLTKSFIACCRDASVISKSKEPSKSSNLTSLPITREDANQISNPNLASIKPQTTLLCFLQ